MFVRNALILISALAMSHQAQARDAQEAERARGASAPISADDLTGYWRDDDNEIVYFTQDGARLISQFTKSAANGEYAVGDIDFNATIINRLVHGARRRAVDAPKSRKCPKQIWVGFGLTLSDDGNMLNGYRVERLAELDDCPLNAAGPLPITYRRMLDEDGEPMR